MDLTEYLEPEHVTPMPIGDKLPPQTTVVKEVLDDRHTLGIDFAIQECFDLRQVLCSFDSTQASVLADEELAFLRPVGTFLLGCPVALPFYYVRHVLHVGQHPSCHIIHLRHIAECIEAEPLESAVDSA